MQLRTIALGAVTLSVVGCSAPDYVVGEKPFLNQLCSYENLDRLLLSGSKQALPNMLEEKTTITSREHGVFVLVLWKKGYNILITGIPERKQFNYIALRRGAPSTADRDLAEKVKASLAGKCMNTSEVD